MATRKNVKVDLNGEKYKVPIPVYGFIQKISEMVRNHEMALFMWKYVIHDKNGKPKDIKVSTKDLHDYIMKIPNADQIVKNMDVYHKESLEIMEKANKIKDEQEKKDFFAKEFKKIKAKDPWIVK